MLYCFCCFNLNSDRGMLRYVKQLQAVAIQATDPAEAGNLQSKNNIELSSCNESQLLSSLFRSKLQTVFHSTFDRRVFPYFTS